MAVSGTQKTRLGASISGAGTTITILAKAASGAPTLNLLNFTRGLGRGQFRGISRGVS